VGWTTQICGMPGRQGAPHNRCVPPTTLTPLAVERVTRDVDCLSRAGLCVDEFFAEVLDSLGRVLPTEGACVATADPATGLVTSSRKYGGLVHRNTHDHEWGLREFGDVEETTFVRMTETGRVAASVHQVTGGDVAASRRMAEFMRPYFGFDDELRGLFLEDGRCWGAVAMFRGDGDHFTPGEVDLLAVLSPFLARGVRSGLLASAAEVLPGERPHGPGVVIVGRDGEVLQMSLGAEAWIEELVTGAHSGAAISAVAALVGAARRYAAGETTTPPRSRLRARNGMWLVLNATPLTGPDGLTDQVVVTIEEARPPEIVPLVVAAFDLTARERDVTQLVLQGVDTKEIAATLHLSTYTVQDHLKAVFTKADVRSRRELVSRVFFDQYQPRFGEEVGVNGWYVS